MSKLDTRTRPEGSGGQQLDAGRDYYNPNPSQDLYNREFNSITAGLGDVEASGRKIINDNADTPEKNTNDVRDKEARGTSPASPVMHQNGKPAKRWQLLTSKKLRGKTSLITVALLLFGGGGAVTIFGGPSTAIVQLQQVLTQDLNDQLKAFENRHAYMLRSKLKTTTNGSCGVVKIACRFSTMSDRQAEKFTRKGVTIERDMNGSLLSNRGRIVSMTFSDPDGGDPIKVSSAEELMDKMQNDPKVRASMQRAENPWFASMTDKTFKSALRKLGTSKTSRITGNTNEERERSVNAVTDSSGELDAKNLTQEIGEDDKPTGRYIGPDGEVLTDKQIESLKDSAKIAEDATKIKPSSIVSSIGKGVMITGAVDSACSVYNASRMVGALAKTEKAKLAAQIVMPSLLVPASKIMAGVATDEETEFVGNKINNIGGPEQPEKIVDESKIYDSNTTTNPPTKNNDRIYATAWESPGVKAASYGDVIPLDSNEARFSLGGGFIGTLAKINSFIAMAVSGGNPDPKVISSKCKYVQNPYVRIASLGAGIFVGLGTFGFSQVASIGASLAISMALPYMISMAADIAAGDVYKNLYGSDFGSGSFVGTAAIMSTAAQSRGMKPLSANEAVAYTQSNQETLAKYADTERYLARAEPFNIYNQYSFMGSIAATLAPTLSQSQSSASMMASTVAGIIPTTFANLLSPTTKAANTIERFQQCEDPGYKSLNIGADIYCNVRYGLSEEELAMDPVENANWMVASGNVAADNEAGEPLENDQSWNYKKFMDECANRTVGYGEDQEENQGDGSNCLSAANEKKNKHFRVFTLDRSVADYMDGDDEVSANQTGSSGDVTSDGWAYPTTKDAMTTSGYKPADRPDHRGLDLAQPGSALGKPIYAARDGKVVASGPASGFGNWIVLLHENVDGKTYSTVYGHMRAADLMVRVGDTVKAGQQISRIGSEGQSSGPHLHFELWNGNAADGTCRTNNGDCSLDPTAIMEKAKAGGDTPPSEDARRNV